MLHLPFRRTRTEQKVFQQVLCGIDFGVDFVARFGYNKALAHPVRWAFLSHIEGCNMAWRDQLSRPNAIIHDAEKQRRRARRIERAFRQRHGMSSMEHLKTVLAGKNEVLPDCGCYACTKHYHEQKSFYAKMRTTKASLDRVS